MRQGLGAGDGSTGSGVGYAGGKGMPRRMFEHTAADKF